MLQEAWSSREAAFMTGIAFTGWGAPIAGVWFVADFGTGLITGSSISRVEPCLLRYASLFITKFSVGPILHHFPSGVAYKDMLFRIIVFDNCFREILFLGLFFVKTKYTKLPLQREFLP